LYLKKPFSRDPQKDLTLFADVEDDSDCEEVEFGVDVETNPIKKDEIRDFLKELNISQYRPAR